jgi:signal transduction histidine kinase
VVIHNEHLIIKVLIRLSDLYKHGQNYLKIEFIDNGIGISDGMKKNLFEPKKFEGMEGKGMGIGLTIVKMIIESYKGKIWVENAVPGDHSKGSNFVLLIPSFR